MGNKFENLFLRYMYDLYILWFGLISQYFVKQTLLILMYKWSNCALVEFQETL